MKVKLLTRWGGDDHAVPGDIVEMDDENAAHHCARGTCVLAEPLPAAPTPEPAQPIVAAEDDPEPVAPVYAGKRKR